MHSAETENLQLEESDAERIACGQDSSEPKQKRRKASAHSAIPMQNVGTMAPSQIGSNAYPAVWGSQASTWMPPGGSWMQPQGGPWMQQQGGGWMMPGPQYMQPPPMAEAHMQTQLAPDSIGKDSRIRKRPGVDQVVQERTAAGRKPYTLRVKAGGEIAGGCPGKNAWDAAVRISVPRTLDMSVLSWKEQSPDAIAELRERLDRDFEYVGYHLTECGFRNAVKRFMKSERARLKRQYQEGHTACPIHIEEEQWTKLKEYWNTDVQMEKSRKMVMARGSVKVLSTVGRKGKDGREEQEVSLMTKVCIPT